MNEKVYQVKFTAEQVQNLIEILEYTLEDCLEGKLGEELEIDEQRIDEIITALREARKRPLAQSYAR